ncbi:MAG TPA: hypothetical protein VNO54_20230, partial [Streptosporangiaceae bacterium]|nr:hypothetical protein [Streptosporangiaceae bacterium]
RGGASDEGKFFEIPSHLTLSLDHPGAGRAWLLIVLVSVFDSRVRFPFAGGVGGLPGVPG